MNSFYYKITCSQFPQISLAGHVRITPPYVHTCRRPVNISCILFMDGEGFLEKKMIRKLILTTLFPEIF